MEMLLFSNQGNGVGQMEVGSVNSRIEFQVVYQVEGHFNPGLFNPKLQPKTFQLGLAIREDEKKTLVRFQN